MVREETGRGKDRFKISELSADERCSEAILDFLATTEVGRTAGPPVVDKEPGSEASEWEKREREGYSCQPSKGRGGAQRPHRGGDLRRIRSGGEKGFVICYHDLYR